MGYGQGHNFCVVCVSAVRAFPQRPHKSFDVIYKIYKYCRSRKLGRLLGFFCSLLPLLSLPLPHSLYHQFPLPGLRGLVHTHTPSTHIGTQTPLFFSNFSSFLLLFLCCFYFLFRFNVESTMVANGDGVQHWWCGGGGVRVFSASLAH